MKEGWRGAGSPITIYIYMYPDRTVRVPSYVCVLHYTSSRCFSHPLVQGQVDLAGCTVKVVDGGKHANAFQVRLFKERER